MIGTRWDTTPILIVSQITAQFEKHYLVTILRSYLVLLVLARRLCVFMVGETTKYCINTGRNTGISAGPHRDGVWQVRLPFGIVRV